MFGFFSPLIWQNFILQLIMEKSSQNENKMNNNDETHINDVVMEKEKMEEKFKIYPSLQT